MKQNKNFLDNLDSGWSDAISDTYEEHNTTAIHDSRNNIILKIEDTNNPNTSAFENDYRETYETSDGNFLFDLSVTLSTVAFFQKSEALHFTLLLTDTDNYQEEISINLIMYSSGKTNEYTFDTVSINTAFLKEFLNRAKESIKIKDPNLIDYFIEFILKSVPTPKI